LSFREVVGKLLAAGVEYYHVDCRPLRLEQPRSKNWQIVTVDY
jgi:hypothetical protein